MAFVQPNAKRARAAEMAASDVAPLLQDKSHAEMTIMLQEALDTPLRDSNVQALLLAALLIHNDEVPLDLAVKARGAILKLNVTKLELISVFNQLPGNNNLCLSVIFLALLAYNNPSGAQIKSLFDELIELVFLPGPTASQLSIALLGVIPTARRLQWPNEDALMLIACARADRSRAAFTIPPTGPLAEAARKFRNNSPAFAADTAAARAEFDVARNVLPVEQLTAMYFSRYSDDARDKAMNAAAEATVAAAAL